MKRTLWFIFVVLLVAGLILPGCTPKTQKISVALDATWPPFESIDDKGNIVGFDADLIKAIAAKENLDPQLNNVEWGSLKEGMAKCQYDIAISSITITEERKQSFSFSDPYFAAGQIVTVQKSNTNINSKDDLGGKKIGVQSGTTGESEVQKISGATVKSYDQIAPAFQDLMNGQVDAVVTDNPLVLVYVGQNPDKLKTVGEVFTDEFYGIAVCKNKPDLLAKINRGLAAVKTEGLIDQLTQKWILGSGK